MQSTAVPALKDVKSLSEICQFWPTEKDIIQMLMNENLLMSSMKCEKCGKEMTLRSRGLSYEWRCRVSKSKDCSTKAIKANSFFSSSKLSLTQAVKILVLWSKEFSAKQIATETGVSENTISDWRNFLRELCVEIEKAYDKLGGNDNICEIDETNIHSRKYGVGKGTKADWVIGAVDRTTGRVFAKRVPNRTASTLVPILQQKIKKDSIVYSDEWKSYSQLKKYFSSHYTVQHKIQFVNIVGTRRICTNGIESFWSRLKRPFKAGNGTSSALLDSYISEYVVRENEKAEFFTRVVEQIRIK